MPDFLGTVPAIDDLPLSGYVYPEDTFTESTAITSYREGISVMPTSAAADWADQGVDAVVYTVRTGGIAFQQIHFDFGYEMHRWVYPSDPDWSAWTYYRHAGEASPALEDYTNLGGGDPVESDSIQQYAPGLSIHTVTSAANFGPNAGEAGFLITYYMNAAAPLAADKYGQQIFVVPGTETSYTRYYENSAWSSWSSDKVNIAAHLADTSDAHDASAISILDTAAQYTATNAEDALAEVLDALQAHEADTTDAHDASAISYAGGTGMSATNIEAAVDELANEKLDATSYTAADVLSKLLTVDGSGSGLDADLLDGNSSAAFATSSHNHDATYVNESDHTKAAHDALDIDADTLDGIDSTGFATSGHTHSGLAPTAGTTGQVLKKNSNTNYDYSWATDETGAGGALSLTEVEKDLGSAPVTSGSFQITGLSGLTAGRHVLIRQALGPYTGKGTLADEYEMDTVQVAGKVTDATTIQCYWTTDSKVRGNFKFAYAVG